MFQTAGKPQYEMFNCHCIEQVTTHINHSLERKKGTLEFTLQKGIHKPTVQLLLQKTQKKKELTLYL